MSRTKFEDLAGPETGGADFMTSEVEPDFIGPQATKPLPGSPLVAAFVLSSVLSLTLMLACRYGWGSPKYLFPASLLAVGVTVGIGFRWSHERYSRIPERKPVADVAERRIRTVAISVVLTGLLFLAFSIWPFHAALFVPSFVWGATMLLVSGVELRGRPWGFLKWVVLAVVTIGGLGVWFAWQFTPWL